MSQSSSDRLRSFTFSRVWRQSVAKQCERGQIDQKESSIRTGSRKSASPWVAKQLKAQGPADMRLAHQLARGNTQNGLSQTVC